MGQLSVILRVRKDAADHGILRKLDTVQLDLVIREGVVHLVGMDDVNIPRRELIRCVFKDVDAFAAGHVVDLPEAVIVEVVFAKAPIQRVLLCADDADIELEIRRKSQLLVKYADDLVHTSPS